MSGIEVEVLGTDPGVDEELDAFFDACPQSFAQQTRHWREVIVGLGVDEPHFVGARRDGALIALLPGYRFEGPLGAILTSVPQAGPLGGIALRPGETAEAIYPALLEGYLALARDSGCVLASLISNPIQPDRALYDRAAPDYTLENIRFSHLWIRRRKRFSNRRECMKCLQGAA